MGSDADRAVETQPGGTVTAPDTEKTGPVTPASATPDLSATRVDSNR